MSSPADSAVQNLLPVQAYFDTEGNFQTFIGQGQPFYATPDPDQSGLHITNSTIDSSVIGGITPAAATFTTLATTTGSISTTAVNPTDITNKSYVDNFVAGISWKAPAIAATTANITLSGTQTIDGVAVVAGDVVLVKNQSTASENGIYTVAAGAWTRTVGADTWLEYEGAVIFVISGTTNAGTTWYCSAQPGGTLGTTALNWFSLSISLTYTAGTGLTLAGTQFSITNTGVSAATYGAANTVPVVAINAQGQITSATNTSIAINGNQITSGTIGSAYLSGSYSGITGVGTLTDLTVTNTISGSINGNAATATTAGSATTATTATNIAGGASGSIPYQTASGTTSLLAKGTDGQILSLASGLPAWINNTVGTVTSVSGTGTVSGITLSGTVTSSGSLTLGGALDLSSPPAIGGTTANSIRGTSVTATSSFIGPYYDASSSAGGALRNASGTAQLQWGSGGGNNVTLDVSTNMNGTNAQIDISPTGTGHVHINPTGSGSVQIAPTSAGTMDNIAIGGTTPLAGTFTTLRVNSTISLAGSTGTAGYVLTSNGASAPTWAALPATGITITDDTTTNATRYLTFTSATSGSVTGENVSSTKLQFNPSTGALTATSLTPSNAVSASYGGTGQTSLTANNVLLGNGTSGVQFVAPGTSGNVLTSNGTTWTSAAPGGGFTAGTRMIFAQTSAPTGWTKDTVNYNNHALRVVTGSASTGGSVDFTTAFASQTPSGSVSITSISGSAGATTLTTTQIPSHSHDANRSGGGPTYPTIDAGSNFHNLAFPSGTIRPTGGGSSHDHPFSFSSGSASFSGNAINLAVKYLDVITATKD